MQDKQKRRIQSIIIELKAITEELEEILANETEPASFTKNPKINVEILVEKISTLDRESAIKYLKELKRVEVSEVFVATGGSGSDKQKPTKWLIEQIIWSKFDFSKGHNAIRET